MNEIQNQKSTEIGQDIATETTPKVEETYLQRSKEYWANLGPGLITGAADDDPSGVTTYSQTGAKYGFQLLWLSLFTFPFMAVVQEMCARIGIVTGRGLAANIRHNYSKKVLYFATTLLFAANTLNIAADLGAMAAGTQLLIPNINFGILVIFFGVLSLVLQIFTTYGQYAKYLKYMTFTLFAYVFAAMAVHLNWGDALRHTILPSLTFSKDQLLIICAILGTTISPYLFFWQTSQEVEEEILHGEVTVAQRQHSTTPASIKKMRIDVWSGMFFSNLIMFFIIVTCAATLYTNGITNITSAAQAASALKPFAGNFSYFFFAVGIIGTGLLAIPVLAGSSAYAIAESFGWKFGLYKKLNQAYSFYGIIIVSVVIGLITNFLHLDPIKMLIYSAVANGLVSPIVLILIVHLSRSKKVMGQYANSKTANVFGYIITSIMFIAGAAAIYSMF